LFWQQIAAPANSIHGCHPGQARAGRSEQSARRAIDALSPLFRFFIR
jgi:hypothetical protein